MVDVRNGVIHAGAGPEPRFILLDCLAVVGLLLERLDIDHKDFFGPHKATVQALLDQRKTEISREVAVKMAKARARLTRLEETLGEAAFEKATDELEDQVWTLDPDDFVSGGGGAIEIDCPECGSKARLFGDVDVSPEVDHDVEVLGGGEYDTITQTYWQASFGPCTFYCTVCRLQLNGGQELAEAGLPSRHYDVSDGELGPDFDLNAHVEAAMYADN